MDKELEKAANNWVTQPVIGTRRESFIAGAKWQAERMYSEEEVNNMFNILKNNSIDNVATISNVDLFIDSWKKQFKKK
jgi:hypothetical protein